MPVISMDRSAVARVSTNKRVLSVTPLAYHRITYSVSFHLALKGTITLLHFAWASPREKNKKQNKQKQTNKKKTNAKTKQKQTNKQKKHCELYNNSGVMYGLYYQYHLIVTA